MCVVLGCKGKTGSESKRNQFTGLKEEDVGGWGGKGGGREGRGGGEGEEKEEGGKNWGKTPVDTTCTDNPKERVSPIVQ